MFLQKIVCCVTVHWYQSWGEQSAWCPQPRHWRACAPRTPGSAAYAPAAGFASDPPYRLALRARRGIIVAEPGGPQ